MKREIEVRLSDFAKNEYKDNEGNVVCSEIDTDKLFNALFR